MAESGWIQITAAVVFLIAALLVISPSAMALMAEMSIEYLTKEADVRRGGRRFRRIGWKTPRFSQKMKKCWFS